MNWAAGKNIVTTRQSTSTLTRGWRSTHGVTASLSLLRARETIGAGTYRAFGYKAPKHGVDDLKLKWREIRIGLHHAPEGSSPAIQDDLGLNRDATLQPKKSEGEKLRG